MLISNKISKKIFFLLGVVFISLGIYAFNECLASFKKQKADNVKLPLGLEEGDIVFRRGNSIASHMVLSADSSGGYSHVGIIVMIDGKLVVAHEVPGESLPGEIDILKTDPLREFFETEKAKSGAIMHVNCSISQKLMAINIVKEKLRINMPFDHDYNLTDSSKMYCTELIWHVYRRAGIDLTNGRRTKINIPLFSGDYILPSDIQASKCLQQFFYFNR